MTELSNPSTRQPNALELQAALDNPTMTPERVMRRMKQQTRHDAQREVLSLLHRTGWALRATNGRLKAGAKTLLAVAGAHQLKQKRNARLFWENNAANTPRTKEV